MTEYQRKLQRERNRRNDIKRTKATKAIRDRESMISTAIQLMYEFGDYGISIRYVKWKVRQIKKESEQIG